MNTNLNYSEIRDIMMQFAQITGLINEGKKPVRYLWTDAFAVCNFLELYRQSGDIVYIEITLHLVDQVHNILGRHRDDDERTGWISGLKEEDGKKHPTKGGLRIGKEMNERKPSDSYDSDMEWDRDGQYYHYLTKWMHALNRVSRVTGDANYNRWAIELARAVHAKFTYIPPGGGLKRMYWKMSIDLTYPLVMSMGHHDPLDGLITYLQLQTTGKLEGDASLPDLHEEITDMEGICTGKQWATHDPLGLGGLLSDACRLIQIIVLENLDYIGQLNEILTDIQKGMGYYVKNNHLKLPADYRLAFRELGLAIGLKGINKMEEIFKKNQKSFKDSNHLGLKIESLKQYLYLDSLIENFWSKPENQKAVSWNEHRHINMVMLATSLAPDGFLNL